MKISFDSELKDESCNKETPSTVLRPITLSEKNRIDVKSKQIEQINQKMIQRLSRIAHMAI